jgi:two-component system NtrC family sensor kinase
VRSNSIHLSLYLLIPLILVLFSLGPLWVALTVWNAGSALPPDGLQRVHRWIEWLFWISGAVALVSGLLIAYAITRPISRLSHAVQDIASGRAPSRLKVDSSEEFAPLGDAFNRMISTLQGREKIRQAERLAALGTLAAGVAHELNNPLNNIAITTEALMEDLKTIDDEEKWRLLQDIYFEAERAGEIVKSLLDFTRHERPELVPLDLAEILRSTFRLAQNEMAINNVTFACDLPEGMPAVRGAANRLRQVFLNLILNAIQAMPRGGRLQAVARTDHPGRICVDIRDEGAGIPPEVLPFVFDPFFTTKEPGKGTGLGLSVSLGIVRSLGGDIQAESEIGKGTTFHVCLPEADAR